MRDVRIPVSVCLRVAGPGIPVDGIAGNLLVAEAVFDGVDETPMRAERRRLVVEEEEEAAVAPTPPPFGGGIMGILVGLEAKFSPS